MSKKIITVVPPSRTHDWVSESQIKKFLPEFKKKVEEVKSDSGYSVHTKNLVTSIYDYLKIHEFISWKQYDAVMRSSKMPPVLVVQLKRKMFVHSGLWKPIIDHLNEKHWDEAFDEDSVTLGMEDIEDVNFLI